MSTSRNNMDPYKQSVQNVDAALARLNATLASYRVGGKTNESLARKSASAPQHGVDVTRNDHSEPRQPSVPLLDAAQQTQPPPVPPSPELVRRATSEHVRAVHGAQAWARILSLRSTKEIPKVTKEQIESSLRLVEQLFQFLLSQREEFQYCLPLYILLAQTYLQLGYPDLAAGEAYKALLLADAVHDVSDEIHEYAFDALRNVVLQHPLVERISLLKNELNAGGEPGYEESRGDEEEIDVEVGVWLRKHYLLLTYRLLVRCLFLCGCFRSAHQYVGQGRILYPDDECLDVLHSELHKAATKQFGGSGSSHTDADIVTPLEWPDHGLVRREVYPWNQREPERLRELPALNNLMAGVSSKLEVRAVELPALTHEAANGKPAVSVQLGVFAKEDIAPGEVVLSEKSMLTANNKLQDALCDACSADLPDLKDPLASAIACQHCDVVFCSQECYDEAYDSYHLAQCDTDSEAILKDVPPAEAADALYSLLLLRALAMAETQECHPLELNETRFIWGDFTSLPTAFEDWDPPDASDLTRHLGDASTAHAGFPRTLPFSFEHNIRLPFHMLEKMDVDIFTTPQYNVWVFNTLFAKFRGTASARLSGLGGRAIRGPEVSAVHPMWCLANHSCDPNVSWEFGGGINFWAREERVQWKGRNGPEVVRSRAGIKKGEEVLNHYCDVSLPVKERREWARGALGGDCRCERCIWEAAEEARV